MSIRVKAIFAQGVTREDVTQTEEAAGSGAQSGPPPGMISHTETTENGRLVFIDEWESRELFDNFINTTRPLFDQAGLPFPEFEYEDI